MEQSLFFKVELYFGKEKNTSYFPTKPSPIISKQCPPSILSHSDSVVSLHLFFFSYALHNRNFLYRQAKGADNDLVSSKSERVPTVPSHGPSFCMKCTCCIAHTHSSGIGDCRKTGKKEEQSHSRPAAAAGDCTCGDQLPSRKRVRRVTSPFQVLLPKHRTVPCPPGVSQYRHKLPRASTAFGRPGDGGTTLQFMNNQ